MGDRLTQDEVCEAMLRQSEERWRDALIAARALAAAGPEIGGLWLTARAGGVRDLYLRHLSSLMPGPVPRLPPGASAASLSGRLDVAETNRTGRIVWDHGILAAVDGGTLVIPMAERLDASAAAVIAEILDTGRRPELVPAGVAQNDNAKTRLTIIALDEAVECEEQIPSILGQRLGLHVNLDGVAWRTVSDLPVEADARATDWRAVAIDDALLGQILTIAAAGGNGSVGVQHRLVKVSRILAALSGRLRVTEEDALTALRICLGIRLVHGEPETEPMPDTTTPSVGDEPDEAECSTPPADAAPRDDERPATSSQLEALQTAIERGTIEGLSLAVSERAARMAGRAGKAGGEAKNARRGRPYAASRNAPYPDARPDLVATLRAAAPWQEIRTRLQHGERDRLLIRKDDFRYQRRRHLRPSTAIFVVDASGSTALERLGETKGAIEELLARCYVRRDEVSLIAFRGKGADLMMPPTRSLTSAKRKLADLPGGGPTPLASGLEKGLELALSVRRRGSTPVVVVMTDGSGNIALDGSADRPLAARQTEQIARLFRAHAVTSICIDIARRPREAVSLLADQLGASLHVLRQADRSRMSDLVHASMEASR
ncbi:VWA domain-containing protein [Rhizobium sp. TRM95796]|uniref:VWA domain-containing protein n=1 Tax=Rhizobium sp. TRM95796 TaxID=2979862 RepID=UPI0021E85A50|nr:VWA domain-containing protein [Rhizobium sp. TRM95796]MCV3768023.1 VWA domain-containing protein [Rhizobium sp. TRM95796]